MASEHLAPEDVKGRHKFLKGKAMKISLFTRIRLAVVVLVVTSGCGNSGSNIPALGTSTSNSVSGTQVSAISVATAVQTPQPQPRSQSETLKIVSSLPLTGAALTDTQTVVNAEQLRLTQAGNQACGGKYKLAFEAWDDASAAYGQWDPAVETENANKAAADPSIIAYLGPFNSGAAKLSIPILDQAGPLVMISPANTYPGLTKPGYGQGEPDIYYPAGIRNYVRVVTADDVQGKVDANFMFSQLGVRSVYLLDDQQLYGKGVADVFESTAKSLSMKVLIQQPLTTGP